MSIRKRLLIWLLPGLMLALALGSWATFRSFRAEIREMQDYEMRKLALSLQLGRMFSVPNRFEKKENQEHFEDEDAHEAADFVGQVWSNQKDLLYSSNPKLKLPILPENGFTDFTSHEERWRVYQTKTARRIVQIAQPLHDRQEAAMAIALRAMLPLFMLTPLLALLIWFAVGKGLAPLKRITEELRNRDSGLLLPLKTDALPAEVTPLVLALNELLVRFSEALEGQRRFLADAAHELRTPLTALNLQAQILEKATQSEERIEAMKELKNGVTRATHLVQQLLTMARLAPEAPQPPFGVVRLDELAKNVVTEYAPIADSKKIDLGVSEDEPVQVSAEPEALRVLLSNLVDNAIRYSPVGGRIDVGIRSEGKSAILEVQDTGPGIPEEERVRVFERFYRRLGQSQPGSGLGLAIVRSIANRHHATIDLQNRAEGQGLMVRVRMDRVP